VDDEVSTSRGRNFSAASLAETGGGAPGTVGPRAYDRERVIAPPGRGVGSGSGGTGEARKKSRKYTEIVRRCRNSVVGARARSVR
jgi:hypothetical protein